MARWTAAEMPSLDGKVAVVTGANSGVGFETARALARQGATVVMACRSDAKAAGAMAQIRAAQPSAALEFLPLDLADLASVRGFAEAFAQRHPRLDVLVNNAGVMAIPRRTTTEGFERQFGTNHLGHFALTGLLLGVLRQTPGARVVTVSSGMHRRGRMAWDDLHGERRYDRWGAYAQSKLANLLFAYELHRRAGAALTSVGTHPGYAATNLQGEGPRLDGSRLGAAIAALGNLFAQSAAMGALPLLYAATADVNGCDYIGPGGMGGMRGYPLKVRSSAASYDAATSARLWGVSEDLTGVRYGF